MEAAASGSKDVIVVGAGFSGLVAAWRLVKSGYHVQVFERADHVGGLIQTLPTGEGLVETAANGLRASARVEELFRDIGVPLRRPKPDSQRRYICVDHGISRWPLSLTQTVIGFCKLVRARSKPPKAGESVAEWGFRALGRPLTEQVLAPALQGVFAAPASELSARAVLARHFDRGRKKPVRGRLRGTVAPADGMGQLIHGLESWLRKQGVVFSLGREITRDTLPSSAAGGTVVLAVSAWQAAKLVREPALQSALAAVRAVPLVTVTVFFERRPIVTGFGILFQEPNAGVLGVLQNSEIFDGRASRGVHSETWILGGLREGAELVTATEQRLLDLIHTVRVAQFDEKSRENFLSAVVTRWPQAIPLYDSVIERHQELFRRGEPGVALYGNYLGEIGLSGIIEDSARLSHQLGSQKLALGQVNVEAHA